MPRSSSTLRLARTLLVLAIIGLLIWGAVAYIIAPRLWALDMRLHPALEDAPTITHTGSGIPGDPLNLGVVGSERQLVRAMLAAGWHPADPLTLKSSERIALDTVLHRPYDDAPVSNLYLWGRKEDLAFEQPVGDDPKKRHHVRFWRSEKLDEQGRPLWMGSATYDERVGLSDTTGQVTHHIGPDVDADRDLIVRDLERVGWVQDVQWIVGFQPKLDGRNGGGDPWRTDGRLAEITLRDEPTAATSQPVK